MTKLRSETDGLINRRDFDEKLKQINGLIRDLDAKNREINDLRQYQEDLENQIIGDGHKEKMSVVYERNLRHLNEQNQRLIEQRATLLKEIETTTRQVAERSKRLKEREMYLERLRREVERLQE